MLQWGESGKPPALSASCAPGFVADIWDGGSRAISPRPYTVYALDRRGHGASHKPGAYHFLDYAEGTSVPGDRRAEAGATSTASATAQAPPTLLLGGKTIAGMLRAFSSSWNQP